MREEHHTKVKKGENSYLALDFNHLPFLAYKKIYFLIWAKVFFPNMALP
jgi:hypothetical protein